MWQGQKGFEALCFSGEVATTVPPVTKYLALFSTDDTLLQANHGSSCCQALNGLEGLLQTSLNSVIKDCKVIQVDLTV